MIRTGIERHAIPRDRRAAVGGDSVTVRKTDRCTVGANAQRPAERRLHRRGRCRQRVALGVDDSAGLEATVGRGDPASARKTAGQNDGDRKACVHQAIIS